MLRGRIPVPTLLAGAAVLITAVVALWLANAGTAEGPETPPGGPVLQEQSQDPGSGHGTDQRGEGADPAPASPGD
ncbi:hypothetical protein PJ985_13405 [Streptomyces sp. ACA25]|uniref:hypothetical protein n=1 Tax=Streptomyces sp. ACA25 TaxID=3022596 RepID=UPI002307729C|nr:hypothetical protein [Streptomyces sp. ACA25]MDB1088565.1 hypothetical protein [Streptomyces sp. ACA25]